MNITTNCIINAMPEDDYHADPCPTPSFSSSVANTLLIATEEEAFIDSKRLNPNHKPRKSDPMDFGKLAHGRVLFGDRGGFEVAPFGAWQSNDAKAAKKDIQSRGLVAFNEGDTDQAKILDLKNMEDALHNQLNAHRDYPGLMMKGKPEQSGFALDEDGLWNRARFDWLDENYPDIIADYKTTGHDFGRWEKNELWSEGKFIQNPHYRHVYDLITGKKSKFVWVVQKTKSPYHIKVFEIDESFMQEVEARYDMARQKFIHCLKTERWRGQPPYTVHSCPPSWTVQGWEAEQLHRDVSASRKQENAPAASQEPVNVHMAG